MTLPLTNEILDVFTNIGRTLNDARKGTLKEDNNKIKSQITNNYLETDVLKFPLDLGTDKTTSNLIKFSIQEYIGGGYNKLSGKGTADLAKKSKANKVVDIYLALPGNLSANNKPGWSVDNNIDGTLTKVGGNIKDILTSGPLSSNMKFDFSGENILSNIKAYGSSGINYMVNNALTIGLANETLNNSASVGMGMNVHPYEETIYKGPGFRAFNYNFNLIPRNEKENIVISNIIQSFRWASTPGNGNVTQSDNDVDISGINILTYPNVFFIEYLMPKRDTTTDANETNLDRQKSETANEKLIKNPWLNKLHPCVCTDVKVDYGSQSKNYMSYDNGSPLTYKITLSFAELIFVTKANINQGY